MGSDGGGGGGGGGGGEADRKCTRSWMYSINAMISSNKQAASRCCWRKLAAIAIVMNVVVMATEVARAVCVYKPEITHSAINVPKRLRAV